MNPSQRVRRNFWVLVAAAAVAAGVLSVAVTLDPGPLAGAVTALSASAAAAAVGLAGRILVVTGRRGEDRPAGDPALAPRPVRRHRVHRR